jgi:mono/diheme cytochrome c family protein
MNDFFAVRLGAAVFLGSILAACAPAYRGEPLTGPLELTMPTLVLGQRVFDANCHQCHPGGAGGLGPSLNDKPLPGPLIAYQVRQGFGAMPAFSPDRLSDGELDALVLYLEELRLHTPEGSPAEKRPR